MALPVNICYFFWRVTIIMIGTQQDFCRKESRAEGAKKMDTALTIIVMILIGALIGGLTNYVAIKMLFRPYEPVLIFGRKMPFTPGLIPKRRSELSEQIGKMVVEHLLTAESIRQKFLTAQFRKDITKWVQNKLKEYETSGQTVADALGKIHVSEEKAEIKLRAFVAEKAENWFVENKASTVSDVLPESAHAYVESKIPDVTSFILKKGQDFFGSAEGRRQLDKMVQDFFVDKGMLWNMVQVFMKNEKLVDKIEPEIQQFLRAEGTKSMINELLRKEWHTLKQRNMEDVYETLNLEKVGIPLQNEFIKMIQLNRIFEKPVGELVQENEELLTGRILPLTMEILFEKIIEHVGLFMEKLHLEQLIKEQIDGFSLQRLEEMILSIAKRELGMITYLGALLGGLIGFVQGMIALWI